MFLWHRHGLISLSDEGRSNCSKVAHRVYVQKLLGDLRKATQQNHKPSRNNDPYVKPLTCEPVSLIYFSEFIANSTTKLFTKSGNCIPLEFPTAVREDVVTDSEVTI